MTTEQSEYTQTNPKDIPINAKVSWYSLGWSKHFDGIYLGSGKIHFGKDSEFYFRYGHVEYAFSMHSEQLFIKGPPLTKEQIIAKRIKRLWNNSNWVKKHPTQAY